MFLLVRQVPGREGRERIRKLGAGKGRRGGVEGLADSCFHFTRQLLMDTSLLVPTMIRCQAESCGLIPGLETFGHQLILHLHRLLPESRPVEKPEDKLPDESILRQKKPEKKTRSEA